MRHEGRRGGRGVVMRGLLVLAAVGPLVLTVFGSLAPSGSAQSLSDRDRAWVLFERSEVLYHEGRYAEAAVLLEEAYDLAPEPVLLFNLARALDRSGQADGARDAYQRYLDEAPDGPTRDRAEEALQRLAIPSPAQALPEPTATPDDVPAPLDEFRVLGEPQPQLPPPEPGSEAALPNVPDVDLLPDVALATEMPRAGPSVDAVPFVLLGLALASGAAATVTGLLSQERHQAAVDAPDAVRTDRLQREAVTLTHWTNGLIITASALAVGGTIWLLWQLLRPGAPPEEGLAWRF